ncbi:hypothetical protein ACN4EK_11950 [Pantanalinema rosaneae CENA516]|uniref:hypothetical protein n=1 Tax=Pantanalinema rosaneae TaxID=1620701 RepID=UPI003D6F746D
MSQDVAQWLAEIQALRQEIAEIKQEREEAYASAANWRQRYETEAQQRRVEANLARQTIDSLKQELRQLQEKALSELDSAIDVSGLQAEVSHWQTVPELQAELVKALAECDRLTKALQQEQTAHIQTRKSLTTALGDAIAQFTKEQRDRD